MSKRGEQVSDTEDQPTMDPKTKFMMEALKSELGKMMRSEMEMVYDRIYQIEQSQPNSNRGRGSRGGRGGRGCGGRGRIDYDEFADDAEYEEEDAGSWHRGGYRNAQDNNLGNIKMNIPSFHGKNDPELYLEWERKVELVFDCQNYSELKKVKLAAVEFSDYALVWWDQLITSRRRNDEPPIQTWREMKAVMRKRFVPNHYYRELYNKLQTLRQGSKTVDEYYKEMEIAMIRANIVEDREATMARFLAGLHWDIRDKVELQHYVELEDMVHMAVKIENQLKRRGNNGHNQRQNQSNWRQSQPVSSGSSSKVNHWKKEAPPMP